LKNNNYNSQNRPKASSTQTNSPVINISSARNMRREASKKLINRLNANQKIYTIKLPTITAFKSSLGKLVEIAMNDKNDSDSVTNTFINYKPKKGYKHDETSDATRRLMATIVGDLKQINVDKDSNNQNINDGDYKGLLILNALMDYNINQTETKLIYLINLTKNHFAMEEVHELSQEKVVSNMIGALNAHFRDILNQKLTDNSTSTVRNQFINDSPSQQYQQFVTTLVTSG